MPLSGGAPEPHIERETKALAYEYGRLTAAYLKGKGRPVPWISDHRPLPDYHVPYLASALHEYVQATTDNPVLSDGCAPIS